MISTRLPRLCSIVAALLPPLLAPFVLETPAHAQLAPTGAHHGARAPDTPGHVSPGGGYGTSVPLDLPAPRSGLPLPLQIAYGDHGVGAAGLGWHIPLSYVRRIESFGRRRPAYAQDAPIEARESVVVSLDGRDIELIPKGPTDWVPRQDAPELILQENSSGWILLDGHGSRYLFTAPPALMGKGIWLLASIAAPGGANTVALDYEVTSHSVAGAPALAMDLKSVRYDTHPTTSGCSKHEVTLGYGAAAAAPLSIAMFDPFVLVRMRTLDHVEVKARPDCAAAAAQVVRRYELSYLPGGDPDTKLPRLKEVRVRGRQGSPEANTTLPVAAYEYGTATNAGKLRYLQSLDVPLPADVQNAHLSATSRDSALEAPSGNEYATWQNLIDVTGDGRLDMVYEKNGDLWVALNRPGNGGSTTLGASLALGALSDATLGPGPFEMHSTGHLRYAYSSGQLNIDEVWRKAIDVNGDGRIDVVDAREEPDRWVVYLNTPGSGSSGVTWVRRSWSVLGLRARLEAGNHVLDDEFVPLSRRATGRDQMYSVCWEWDGSDWHLTQQYLDCIDPPPGTPIGDPWPEETFTEWELTDLNGDHYPDVVYNSSPVEAVGPAPWWEPLNPVHQGFTLLFDVRPIDPDNRVEALVNVVGVRFDEDQSPFSAPLVLSADGGCGVAKWREKGGTQFYLSEQEQICGLFDVNGDGLLDRVENDTAWLGTGAAISDVAFPLPGRMSLHENDHRAACEIPDPDPPPTTTYPAHHAAALRDLTGDGIPDYIDVGDSGFRAWIGTGTGFAPPIPIEVPGSTFALSSTTETCDGDEARTGGGLYDIDGDGKPDIVQVVGDKLQVHQLAGGWVARTPEAGRLVAIDNGHGAKTMIAYRSAKEDGTTLHQVPAPEIVVTSVETIGTLGLGGSTLMTRYARGDVETFFDPTVDAFTTHGYRRSVELRVTPSLYGKGTGTATITDAHGLDDYFLGMDPPARYARYALHGRVTDTHGLSGTLEIDPWLFLAADMGSDPRRSSGDHHVWESRSFHQGPAPGSNPIDCMDVPDPYDWSTSAASNIGLNGYDLCARYGFGFEQTTETWRGHEAPPSAANVATRTRILTMDDLGRALLVEHQNDLYKADDDVCEATTYATPTATGGRILDARSSRRIHDCNKGTTYAQEFWEYDGLSYGNVSLGWATAHTVERRSTSTGALIEAIREWDAFYDDVGNPIELWSDREDGAYRRITATHDPFGLAVTSVTVAATGASDLKTSITRDPITLDTLVSKDPVGTQVGSEFDGFGRVVRRTAAPTGGALGVTATTSYLGFAGGDPLGRRVVTKSFADPVAPAAVASAAGQTGTVHLDELGRERRTEVSLGADYGGETLVTRKTYDTLGRVLFEAAPFALSQDPATAYGTTNYFHPDGSPSCSIRGKGPQQPTSATDEAAERFPTCYDHSFAAHEETVGVRDPASLLAGSPQAGVVKSATSSAIGRLLSRQTHQGTTRVEYATYGYDRLGGNVRISRFQNPVAGTLEVKWEAGLDSLGQKVSLKEPASAQKNHTYSWWGDLLETQWVDAGVERRVMQEHDGLGRVTERSESSGGVVFPDTAYQYFYDASKSPVPGVSLKNLLGRLAYAKSPTGDVYMGYDGFGRVDVRLFTDPAGDYQVEKSAHRFDGNRTSLDLLLSDTGHALEHVDYDYDSAARLRTVKYTSGGVALSLYSATQIDAWGRVRAAQYGPKVNLLSTFADVGRRLPIEAKLSSLLGARQIFHLGFDAVGRETSRREVKNGAQTGPKTNFGYDALGRIASANQSTGQQIHFNTTFGYDLLGNVLSLGDTATTADATLTYRQDDRDRVCRITYGDTTLGGTACNVTHDGAGNVVAMPTRSGATRQIDYFPSGLVRKIHQGTAEATFRYDPFGEVSELDVIGAGVADARHDRRFGAFVERRDALVGGVPQTVFVRRIPGAAGILASRRGPSGPWIFEHAEQRGGRFFTDETGAFVQEVGYRPFGEATSTGSQPGSLTYSPDQWNGGDALAAFGLSHLGARLYDPVIGRFLSRDPLQLVRTAASMNPYAFAMNDPQNLADPTGLDPGCAEGDCGGGDIEWMPPAVFDFNVSDGQPVVQRLTWLDPRVNPNPNPYLSPPTYQFTYHYENGYAALSPADKAVYDATYKAASGSENTVMRNFAHVLKYRYDHRFDKMSYWQEVASRAAEQRAIDHANSRRVLLFSDKGQLERWRARANITPSQVDPEAWEVWSHGSPGHMTTRTVEERFGPDRIMGELAAKGWRPGQPVVLAACKVGADPGGIAQELANRSGSWVYASTNTMYGIAGAPDLAPMGWTVYIPKK